MLPGDLAPAASPALWSLSSNRFKLLIPVQTGGFSKLRHSGLSQAPELTHLISVMDLIGGFLSFQTSMCRKSLLLAILSTEKCGEGTHQREQTWAGVAGGKIRPEIQGTVGDCGLSCLTYEQFLQLRCSHSQSLPKPPSPGLLPSTRPSLGLPTRPAPSPARPFHVRGDSQPWSSVGLEEQMRKWSRRGPGTCSRSKGKSRMMLILATSPPVAECLCVI